MFIVLVGILLLSIFTLKINVKGLDKDYLSRPKTASIKGIFILIVFLSHIRTYTKFTHITDIWTINFLNYLGQLMVALFLFYSGYGVFEAIKKKGKSYIDSFVKNRILKTYFDFIFAILLFLIVGFMLGKIYPLKKILLSLIALDNVGNSSWYMFAVFMLYISTYISFKIVKDKKFISLMIMGILSLAYVYIMSIYKDNYWSSTYLCYVAGMGYSFIKEDLDKILNKYPILYYLLTIIILASYLYLHPIRFKRLMIFNLTSIFFCLSFVFVGMKASINSKFLIWCGDHLFWLYILQRIPMMVFRHIGFADKYQYVFVILCLIITVISSHYVQNFSAYLKKMIWNKGVSA